MDLRIVARDEIEKMKYNGCIHYAANGNVFAYAWYLDQVAKEWQAIVEGDYESVLPLTWKKHWSGQKQIHQPAFVRELGIFSIRALSQKRIAAFLDFIPDEYRWVDLPLNEGNGAIASDQLDLKRMTNHQILLDQPYEVLRSSYSTKLVQQLRSAADAKFVVTTSIKPEMIADFYRQHTFSPDFKEQNFHALQRIMYNALHRGWGHAAAVFDQEKNLLACNFFIYSHHKALSLAPLASPAGIQNGALSYLMDVFIRKHANQKLMLDFNSASDANLAREFGGQVNHYHHLLRKPASALGRLIYG